MATESIDGRKIEETFNNPKIKETVRKSKHQTEDLLFANMIWTLKTQMP